MNAPPIIAARATVIRETNINFDFDSLRLVLNESSGRLLSVKFGLFCKIYLLVCVFNYIGLCLIGAEMVNCLLSCLWLLLYINERKHRKNLYRYN